MGILDFLKKPAPQTIEDLGEDVLIVNPDIFPSFFIAVMIWSSVWFRKTYGRNNYFRIKKDRGGVAPKHYESMRESVLDFFSMLLCSYRNVCAAKTPEDQVALFFLRHREGTILSVINLIRVLELKRYDRMTCINLTDMKNDVLERRYRNNVKIKMRIDI